MLFLLANSSFLDTWASEFSEGLLFLLIGHIFGKTHSCSIIKRQSLRIQSDLFFCKVVFYLIFDPILGPSPENQGAHACDRCPEALRAGRGHDGENQEKETMAYQSSRWRHLSKYDSNNELCGFRWLFEDIF